MVIATTITLAHLPRATDMTTRPHPIPLTTRDMELKLVTVHTVLPMLPSQYHHTLFTNTV